MRKIGPSQKMQKNTGARQATRRAQQSARARPSPPEAIISRNSSRPIRKGGRGENGREKERTGTGLRKENKKKQNRVTWKKNVAAPELFFGHLGAAERTSIWGYRHHKK